MHLSLPLLLVAFLPPTAGQPAFARVVRPILAEKCFSCHGEQKHEADLRLDTLGSDLSDNAAAETWHDVLTRLNLGEMPPKGAPKLEEPSHRALVDWITAELKRTAEARRSTGGRVVLRRLNRDEYANTMRDLLGLSLDFVSDLPPESSSHDGFQNNGGVLGMTSSQLESYLKIARTALGKAIVTGPQPRVFKQRVVQSEAPQKKGQPTSNRLDGHTFFLARLQEFPREGEFRIRIRAGAVIPEEAGYPRLQVSLGVRADTVTPEKLLGEMDVSASAELPQTYEFRGRIEDFPLPGANPKFPGLLVFVRSADGDGQPSQAKPAKKRGAGKQPGEEAPPRSVIVVESLEFEGPVFEGWPPESHTRILFAADASLSESEYAAAVIERFMARAYRRPISPADTAPILKLFNTIRPRASSFEAAMRESLAMVLISPDFLYLVEPTQGVKRPLNDFELASRLSYFLWSSMPDAKLLELASSGKLRDPAVLERQTRAMLADPKAQEFVTHFTDQWLNLSGVERVAVNPEYYPEFDERLKKDMRRETQLFFSEILTQDLSCLNLIESDFAVVNHALARHYGIPGPRGAQFERVALQPEHRRGGLLTQGAILLTNSTGEDSHPIRRAVWLLDRLLDSPPAPPPPDVPELNSEEPSLAGLSLKQQLELHRKQEACNNCHRGIDPWGIPFENYDAVGQWRDQVRRVNRQGKVTESAVVAQAAIPGGKEINGLQELKAHLLTHERERFARALVKKALAYSLGRSLELTDEPAVSSLLERFSQRDYRLSDLIVAIAQSEPFQSK